MDFEKVAKFGSDNMFETTKLIDLNIGQKYIIKKIKLKDTRFGKALLVELVENIFVWLPKKFETAFTAEALDDFEKIGKPNAISW